jgi:peroxiredoxin
MKKIETLIPAPAFELADTRGQSIHLSDYTNKKNVVLVLTRGFV